MEWLWDACLSDPSPRQQPAATPLNAPPDQLTGLPEALVIVDKSDLLGDEGEAYALRDQQ